MTERIGPDHRRSAGSPSVRGLAAGSASVGDADLLPEGHVVAEVRADAVERGGVRRRIAPRPVLQPLGVRADREVLALALPRAGVGRRALLEELALHAR